MTSRSMPAATDAKRTGSCPSGAHYFPTDTESITRAAGAIARFLQEPAGTS